jgi:hypothetical protein
MTNKTLEQASHAMQSGVAMEMNYDPGPTEPKHLRVGVNAALVYQAALARLLVDKGIISWDEYNAAITDEMNREVERYEQRLTERAGAKITLG